MLDFPEIYEHLEAAAAHYKESAPTVAAYLNGLSIRLNDNADQVRVSELKFACSLGLFGCWAYPSYAAKRVNELMCMTSLSSYAANHLGERPANAKLIAAAPDLLAALERLLDERDQFHSDTESCECGENGTGYDDAGKPCEHIQARRAIARAIVSERRG